MQNKSIFLIVVLAVFALSALAGYYGPPMLRDYEAQKQREAFVAPGVPVSKTDAFSRQFNSLLAATEAQTLPDDPFKGIDGKTYRFSDFAGKPTLVNFWATWCTPCIVELPSLEKLGDHYKGRMNVIAVALEPTTTPAKITRFLETREVGNFAGYIDDADLIGKSLKLRGIPTSFLIGSDGLILYRFEGDADWASDEAKAFFDVFLLQKR